MVFFIDELPVSFAFALLKKLLLFDLLKLFVKLKPVFGFYVKECGGGPLA
jgi:hypothetical protein